MNNDLTSVWMDFGQRLRSFIHARVRDDAVADDIRQEVFLRMQQRLTQLKDFSKIESWLWQIARNAIADHFRNRREMVELSDDLLIEREEVPKDGLHSALRRMVDELPDPYREAVRLSEIEGLTQKAVAERLGLSLTGAKSRVQRGRRMLKQMLEDCCQLEFDHHGSVMGCEPRKEQACSGCEE